MILTVSVCQLRPIHARIELTDQEPLEPQKQVQGRRPLLAELFSIQAAGNASRHIFQSGDRLRGDIPNRGRRAQSVTPEVKGSDSLHTKKTTIVNTSPSSFKKQLMF